MEDYPAFHDSLSSTNPRAKRLRALVIRRNPSDSLSSVILLNPAYANAQTLAEAVEVLRSCPEAGDSPAANFVPLVARAQNDDSPVRGQSQAARWLSELRARPVAAMRTPRGVGRFINVDEISACTTPQPQ